MRKHRGGGARDKSNHSSQSSHSGQSNRPDQGSAPGVSDKAKSDPADLELLEDTHNQGFGEWLRSSDGVEMMRLFVLANSLLVFVTMAWPSMQEAFRLVKDLFAGEGELD